MMETISVCHRVIFELSESLSHLASGKKVPSAHEIVTIASLIQKTMSGRDRFFHQVEHPLSMLDSKSDLEKIAILFHDVVYLQVDRRIHPLLLKLLEPFEYNDDLTIRMPIAESLLQDVQSIALIFNFNPDDKIDVFKGANEFLSALAAWRLLEPYLGQKNCISIAAMIEATIPFRKNDPIEQLGFRLKSSFELSDLEIRNIQNSAAVVSNADVENFGSQDLSDFLSNTWALIIEGSPVVRNPCFSVKEYRTALQKIEGFFNHLDSRSVFKKGPTLPSMDDFAQLQDIANRNLKFARIYIGYQVLSLAFLEALSLVCGGEHPYALFVGQTPMFGHYQDSIVKKLIEPFKYKKNKKSRIQDPVARLLEKGRKDRFAFDFSDSAVGTYFYQNLDPQQFQDLKAQSAHFFKAGDVKGATQFLRGFPKKILSELLPIFSKTANIFKDSIMDLEKEI